MLDFVSYYRRFQGINGKQSYSLLYTSINVLAGHYTRWGTLFLKHLLIIKFCVVESKGCKTVTCLNLYNILFLKVYYSLLPKNSVQPSYLILRFLFSCTIAFLSWISYGVKFPVPEKRRKRLLQEFADIDKVRRRFYIGQNFSGSDRLFYAWPCCLSLPYHSWQVPPMWDW